MNVTYFSYSWDVGFETVRRLLIIEAEIALKVQRQ